MKRPTKTSFNREAEKLGCKARISGNKRKIVFQQCIGYIGNHELVVKITYEQFAQLIAPFPTLHF